jgi:CheY-like chemotaxis protein
MSHELRTPLNSLLILSDQLSSNADRNLSAKQVEFAKTIHSSGNDLLMLINDILDLSKIESGTVAVDAGELRMDELQRFVERTFRHVAEAKSVHFGIKLDPGLPKSMFTDSKRLQQIIKNLLSNAFKFTHKGEVTLMIRPAANGWNPENDDLNRAGQVLEFSVQDTGIGISPDKQQIIFEAFQQADGSTSRKYGGTGLGLAISRELSHLLGGEIRLTSAPGRGSVFSLYLPQTYTPTRSPRRPSESIVAMGEAEAVIRKAAEGAAALPAAPAMPADSVLPDLPVSPPGFVNEVGDDRDTIQAGNRIVLIVENDLGFARVLLEAARSAGFKGVVTSLGAAALTLVHELKPHAITLDLHLPDVHGWRVLTRLKNDLAVRHIPVYVISTDEAREQAMLAGAQHFIAKPLPSRKSVDDIFDLMSYRTAERDRVILVVEPESQRRERTTDFLQGIDGVEIIPAPDTARAEKLAQGKTVGCIIAHPLTPEAELTSLVAKARNGGAEPPPLLLYSGDTGARHATQQVPGAREAQSLERLLDEVVQVMALDVEYLSERHRDVLHNLYRSSKPLENKTVLIVDDDIRNIFALSSVLEEYDVRIASADNGRDAIAMLKDGPAVDAVLMDVMMPEMDGLDTTREIRKIPHCKDLPIVAVTAKAMKGDRERCIEAGAWDYLSKPVDRQQLLNVLRAWLQR